MDANSFLELVYKFDGKKRIPSQNEALALGKKHKVIS